MLEIKVNKTCNIGNKVKNVMFLYNMTDILCSFDCLLDVPLKLILDKYLII